MGCNEKGQESGPPGLPPARCAPAESDTKSILEEKRIDRKTESLTYKLRSLTYKEDVKLVLD